MFFFNVMFCYVIFMLFYNANLMIILYLLHNPNAYTQEYILKVNRVGKSKFLHWDSVKTDRKMS